MDNDIDYYSNLIHLVEIKSSKPRKNDIGVKIYYKDLLRDDNKNYYTRERTEPLSDYGSLDDKGWIKTFDGSYTWREALENLQDGKKIDYFKMYEDRIINDHLRDIIGSWIEDLKNEQLKDLI